MADRVGHGYRLAVLDHQPDQSLVDPHRDLADRFLFQADRGAQHQALALGVEEVERTDLDLHAGGDRGDDLIEGLAQRVGGVAADGGDVLDEREPVAINCHDSGGSAGFYPARCLFHNHRNEKVARQDALPMKNASPRRSMRAARGWRDRGPTNGPQKIRRRLTRAVLTLPLAKRRSDLLTPPPCLGGGLGWGSSEEAPDVCFLRRFLVLIFMP